MPEGLTKAGASTVQILGLAATVFMVGVGAGSALRQATMPDFAGSLARIEQNQARQEAKLDAALARVEALEREAAREQGAREASQKVRGP